MAKGKKSRPTYDIKNGVHCTQFTGGDTVTYNFFIDADVERFISVWMKALEAGASLTPDEDGSLHADWEGQSLVFDRRAAAELAKRRNERGYLVWLTLHRDYLEWASNFIPLKAGVMDKQRASAGLDIPLTYLAVRPPPPGSGPEAQVSTEELKNITEALDRHDVFIVLGEPGCGKTTTLQKIAYDHALACLKDPAAPVPFFVRLSEQHKDAPFEFLEKKWKEKTNTSFADALSDGRFLLLLDGVNELPRDDTLTTRLNDWRLFASEYGDRNRIVFSGREKDYKGSLDLPRVIVRKLDGDLIADYLRRNHAEGLLEVLKKASPDARRRMQDLLENPLHLSMLTRYFLEMGAGIENRGELFRWFANALIAREKSRHPENDPKDTPVEVRLESLARLAYAWQERELGTVIPVLKADEILPANVQCKGKTWPVEREELVAFGRGARIFDPGMEEDLRFQHQMLQEYFAALELLRRFGAGEDLTAFWMSPRTVEEMPPANVGEWDPLPEPPSKGWDVTTLLACGLAGDAAKLIDAVRLANPALAGRCLDEAGIEQPAEVLAATQADLLADLYDPHLHLRARLQAGYALGRIKDSRFKPKDVNGVKVVLPEMVPVPAGSYRIGSGDKDEDAYDDEKPSTMVDLPAFSIGRWPVTNAEFACFITAGGYKHERFWKTDLARRWLKGEEVAGGQIKGYMDQRKLLLDSPGWQEQVKDIWSPKTIKTWEYYTGLEEEQANIELSKGLSSKSRSEPAYTDDPRYNNPSQPVVGITWFEASAYCAWLSEVTGREYRLPGEAEWEAAARGTEGRVYPWGEDWDPGRANTIEGRVMKPSPVGAYAASGGMGPFKAEDQAGNVREWTSSLYLPYPYDPGKSESPEAEGEHVLRGGSWVSYRGLCRCAYRLRNIPDNFGSYIGFRLVSPGSDAPKRSGGDSSES